MYTLYANNFPRHFYVAIFNSSCDEPSMFRCGSGDCIHASNVCDGHSQCNDGSDEGEERCFYCPSGYGKSEATFKCKHR